MKSVDIHTSAAIIFKESNPRTIFTEWKDEGYPNAIFRNHIFPFGGGIEPGDNDPKAALVRELREELGEKLAAILPHMEARLTYDKDFLYHIPEEVLIATGSKRQSEWLERISLFYIPLDDATWDTLENLQNKYGNLSSESRTRIVTLEELPHLQVSWEYAYILKDFFSSCGFAEAQNIPCKDGVEVTPA